MVHPIMTTKQIKCPGCSQVISWAEFKDHDGKTTRTAHEGIFRIEQDQLICGICDSPITTVDVGPSSPKTDGEKA